MRKGPITVHRPTNDMDEPLTGGEPWPKAQQAAHELAAQKAHSEPVAIIERHRSIPLPPGIPLPDTNSATWAHVFAFACAMEHKLSLNRKKGDAAGWRKDGPRRLQDRLDDEVEELNQAMWGSLNPDKREVLLEAVDVANFAMMIADCFTSGK